MRYRLSEIAATRDLALELVRPAFEFSLFHIFNLGVLESAAYPPITNR
jgi:hypothetical protein